MSRGRRGETEGRSRAKKGENMDSLLILFLIRVLLLLLYKYFDQF